MRKQVAVAAGAGMSHEEISIALGISRNTLEKHFKTELSIGSLERRMEIVTALHAAARKGNVAAMKAYLAFTPTAALPPVGVGERRTKAAAAQRQQPGTPPPLAQPGAEDGMVQPAALVLGKKDQAQLDAKTAHVGSDWGDILRAPDGPMQ